MIIDVTLVQPGIQGGLEVFGYSKSTCQPVMCCVNANDGIEIVTALDKKQRVQVEIDSRWVLPMMIIKRRDRAARASTT